MNAQLAPGTTVRLRNFELDCVVGECLGSGGQGEVYRVTVGEGADARMFALKWYRPEWSTRQQWTDLVWLTRRPPPSACFLWPIDVASAKVGIQTSSFGYVMPLREPRYRSCADIVTRRVDMSFSALLTACLRLSEAFLSLHAQGLCYRDISFGNAFIDPVTGDVLIADNDNVAIDLEGSIGIRGTDLFMAPEIVRGEALPSVATDLYSLAVLLFYLLMVAHPLEGRRMLAGDVFGRDEAAALYGFDPLFVFDPHDDANAPDPERQTSAGVFWPLYPRMLRDLFVRAFTDGLHDPAARVREGEWCDCLARVLDLVVPCGCGADGFVEPDGAPVTACWSCFRPAGDIAPLPMLVLEPAGERHAVALNVGRRLYGHHLGQRRYDYRPPARAEVTRHPDAPDVHGLQNRSGETWTAVEPGGGAPPTRVAPGRTVAIVPGTAFDFGQVTGVIERR